MLQLLVSDEFTQWFGALKDEAAEDVATALEIVERLGPEKAPPESREALLWYEHASVSRFAESRPLAFDLEAWGRFRDYASSVLRELEAPRFLTRLSRLSAKDANLALEAVRHIRRSVDPRMRWRLKLSGAAASPRGAAREQAHDACEEVRRLYFAALEAAGFLVEDVPTHSLALRELSRRVPGPAFHLLYGVDAKRETALIVVGEWLDRSFYGDSVRRAEKMWKQFLTGNLEAIEPAPMR